MRWSDRPPRAAALVGTVGRPRRRRGAEDGWTWPVRGRVLTTYTNDNARPYAGGMHRGIDIAAAVGTPVVAARAGAVTFAGPLGSSGLTCRGAHRGRALRDELSAPGGRGGRARSARGDGRAFGGGRDDRPAVAGRAASALRRAARGCGGPLCRPAVAAAAARGGGGAGRGAGGGAGPGARAGGGGAGGVAAVPAAGPVVARRRVGARPQALRPQGTLAPGPIVARVPTVGASRAPAERHSARPIPAGRLHERDPGQVRHPVAVPAGRSDRRRGATLRGRCCGPAWGSSRWCCSAARSCG